MLFEAALPKLNVHIYKVSKKCIAMLRLIFKERKKFVLKYSVPYILFFVLSFLYFMIFIFILCPLLCTLFFLLLWSVPSV